MTGSSYRLRRPAWGASFFLLIAMMVTSTVHASEVAVPAFGGHLVGTDRGEWIGELAYVARDGTRQTLLRDNVFGIANGGAGTFVIAGLAHGTINRGAVYRIDRAADDTFSVNQVIVLTGSPSQVRTYSDGTADFLVLEGWIDDDRRHFRCYRLANARAESANTCEPPPR